MLSFVLLSVLPYGRPSLERVESLESHRRVQASVDAITGARNTRTTETVLVSGPLGRSLKTSEVESYTCTTCQVGRIAKEDPGLPLTINSPNAGM